MKARKVVDKKSESRKEVKLGKSLEKRETKATVAPHRTFLGRGTA